MSGLSVFGVFRVRCVGVVAHESGVKDIFQGVDGFCDDAIDFEH